MRTPRHVIWDWNGTLLDDAWLCVEVMNALLVEHALTPIDEARYQALFSFPVVDYYRKLGFDFARTPFEQVGTAFIHGYQARQHECELQDGAYEVFEALKAKGISMSVLSASQQSRLEAQARHLGVTEKFVKLVGLDHHYADGKLELGRQWLAELGHAPEEVLLIGDTDHDLHVAQTLGMECFVVPSGHQSPERLTQAGARLATSLKEIADLLSR